MEGRNITVKSADPRLLHQEELGCYYPTDQDAKSNSGVPSRFDFDRSSLPTIIKCRIEEASKDGI